MAERYSRDTVVLTTAEINELVANKALDPTVEYWVDRNKFAYAPTKETMEYLVSGDGIFRVQSYGGTGDGRTNDTTAIQAAIDAMTSAGGGVLLFGPGRYMSDGGHELKVPCIVMGSGFGTIPAGTNGASIISLRNGANADVFKVVAKNVTICDIGIYGNKGNQTAGRGIAMSSTMACNYFRLNRVWINATYSDGVRLVGPSESLEGFMHQCRIDACGGYGISVVGGAADCQATDTVVCSNALGGVQINAGSFVLNACHIWGNTGAGVTMPSGAAGAARIVNSYIETNTVNGIQTRGAGNIISNNRIWKNGGRGIYAFSNTGLVVTGNTITANNTSSANGAAGAGCNFDTCTASVVQGNFFNGEGQPQKYGYAETDNTCNACAFVGNISRATDHGTGSHLVGTGNPTSTVVANNVT